MNINQAMGWGESIWEIEDLENTRRFRLAKAIRDNNSVEAELIKEEIEHERTRM